MVRQRPLVSAVICRQSRDSRDSGQSRAQRTAVMSSAGSHELKLRSFRVLALGVLNHNHATKDKRTAFSPSYHPPTAT